MPDPIHLLRADYVERVTGNAFERFCVYLLDSEVHRRHRGGNVDGNPPQYQKDGGVDILVTITQAPSVLADDFPYALTPDVPGTVAVACKTGQHWEASLKADAKKVEFARIVKDGGHAVMFTHKQLGPVDKDNLSKELAEILAGECALSPEEVAPRFKLVDANQIAGFYAYRPTRLDLGLRHDLSVADFNGLLTLEEWATRLRHLRPEPGWVPDGVRADAIAAIQEEVRRSPAMTDTTTIWVSGPPGVGKSRLVLEALRAPDIAGRVLASSDFQYGFENIHGSDAPRLADGILVVDECSRADASGLAATFAGRSKGQGTTLILIGPPDKSIAEPFHGQSLILEPLEGPAERELVQRELGAQGTDELVARVTYLTEGFPWFAVLLAEVLREDPSALPATANRWDAAALAIAGPKKDHGDSQERQLHEALLRAKALLAVMMTEGTNWEDLTVEQETRFGLALDAPWSDIKTAAIRCYDRGLVRERQNWRYKYVTPRNIGRLVATHLLSAPLSIGARIRNHVPELRDYLYHRLQDAEVPENDLQRLANEDVRPFELDPSWELLRTLPISLLAHYSPDVVARAIRKFVDLQSLSELAQRAEERRPLVFALNHVCRRKLGFFDAEAALFRLALAENESWGNNATGVWKSLFLGALSLTHFSFDRRLDILEAHFDTQSVDELRLLSKALSEAVGQESSGVGFTDDDKVDGDWYPITWGEIFRGKVRAWNLLVKYIKDQGNVEIRDELCEIAATHLRSAVGFGIGLEVIELLLNDAASWPALGQAKLRENIAEIKDFDSPLSPEVEEALEKLRVVVVPRDYHGRLMDVVGNWHPAGHILDAEEYGNLQARESRLDEDLARAGLDGVPPPLLEELGWLSSDSAVRATPFMYHVGLLDEDLGLLEPATEVMAMGNAANSFSSYLAGVAKAKGQDRVDEVLEHMKGDPRYSWAFVLTLWRAGLTDKRTQWLAELIRDGQIAPDTIGPLEHASWSGVEIGRLRDLIDVLSEQKSAVCRNVALHIVIEQEHRFGSEDNHLLSQVLLRVSDGFVMGTMEAHYWEVAARKLLTRGDVETVVQAAVLFIGTNEQYRGDENAWKVLVEAMSTHTTLVWERLTPLIEGKDEISYRTMLEIQHHKFLSRIPVDTVMDWIDRDETRAMWVALMCSVQSAQLDELTRQLLIRFGPESAPANELSARAGSTDGVVSSLAGHAKKQMENAENWALDAEPAVAAWGKRMIEQLARSYESHAAWEEFQDRQR